jgi:hypothetical protein
MNPEHRHPSPALPGARPASQGKEKLSDSPSRPTTQPGDARGRRPSLGNTISRRLWPLDGEKLSARARQHVGLEDFGNPPIEPALSVLVESIKSEADLHPLGRFLARTHLQDILETRLRLVNAWKNCQALELQELRRPIFVTGTPRSGSTFLHELLAEDPAHRAPRVWEVMYPLRSPKPTLGNGTAQVWRAEASLWWFRRLAPQADAVYPMRANTPHECVAIQSYSLLSQEFISTFRIPTYEAFLDAADLFPAYAWQKRFLQYLQAGRPPGRWVLKSPDHVRSLDALWQAFPDAVIIQTHRNPLEVLVSSSHLTEVLRQTFARPVERRQIGVREAHVLAENMDRITRFRDAHPELADRFIDVQYPELIADPEATVRRVYQKLGVDLQEKAAARMRHLAANRRRYANGRGTRPTLAEFGLDARTEVRRFENYCSRFSIACS